MQITLKQMLGQEPLAKRKSFNPESIQFYNVTNNDDFDDLPGFCHDTAQTWIYPNNLPVRKYQLEIVGQALFRNTLVCLPTGLGKTFIAAVVILNFLRWFPSKKVVFMAPTKPLVSQQREACLKFTCIPANEFVELTGSINNQKRKAHWDSKRLFFLTPQVLMNDLNNNICPGSELCCLIFDEAHKASGNYAYCEIIRSLTNENLHNHRLFRVLALTASPSSTFDGLQEVICNLLITHFEFRSNNSPEIKQYNHSKEFEKIVVPLSKDLLKFKDELVGIARENLHILSKTGIIYHSLNQVDSLSAFKVVNSRKELLKLQSSLPNHKELSARINILEFLCRSLEYLIKHGLRCAFNYMTSVMNGSKGSPIMREDVLANKDIDHLYKKILIFFSSSSQDLSQTQSTKTHPKLEKLVEIVVEFFENKKDSGKIIIFSHYRDSVDEILAILLKKRPLIRPASFIGQSARQKVEMINSAERKKNTQKDQIRIMESFRDGIFNTLVSTSIGEEGVDIGQVDLIICFDSSRSPIQLIQRSGRTGRMREGRVIFLLSEGKEAANFESGIAMSNSIEESLVDKKTIEMLSFYPNNPRMIPLKYEPKLEMTMMKEEQSNGSQVNNAIEKKNNLRKIRDSFKSLQELIPYKSLHPAEINLGIMISSPYVNTGPIMTLTKWRPRLITQPIIRRCRQDFQSSSRTSLVGPSISSVNLVAQFRLSYLLRKRISTHQIYTCGIRSVDVSKNFSDLIINPFEETVMTQTQYCENINFNPEPIEEEEEMKFIIGPGSGFNFPTLETLKGAETMYLNFDKCPNDAVIELLDNLLSSRNRVKRSSLDSGASTNSSAKTSTPINANKTANCNHNKENVNEMVSTKMSVEDFTFTEDNVRLANPDADTIPISLDKMSTLSVGEREATASNQILLESFQFGAIEKVKDDLDLFYKDDEDDLFADTIIQKEDSGAPSSIREAQNFKQNSSFLHLFQEVSVGHLKIANHNTSVEMVNEDWESNIQGCEDESAHQQTHQVLEKLPNFFDDDDEEEDLFNESNQPTLDTNQVIGEDTSLKSPEINSESFSDDEIFSLNKAQPKVDTSTISSSSCFISNKRPYPTFDKHPWDDDDDNDDDDEFFDLEASFKTNVVTTKKAKVNKRNKKFILSQAEQSGDEDFISSGNEGNSLDDFYEASFINDDENISTQLTNENKSMTSFYLKSIKPNEKHPGPSRNFKLLDSPFRNEDNNSFSNVYSQSMVREELRNEEYEMDSFLVSNDVDSRFNDTSRLSDGPLTQVLKRAKENRRRNKAMDLNHKSKSKKRRIVFMKEDDDQDDFL